MRHFILNRCWSWNLPPWTRDAGPGSLWDTEGAQRMSYLLGVLQQAPGVCQVSSIYNQHRVTPHCLQDSVFSGRLPTSVQVGNFLWAAEMPLGFQSWYPWGSGSLCMQGQDVGQVLSGAFVLGPDYAFISSCTEWRGQHFPAILLGCLCLGCLHQESGKNGIN